MSKYVDIEPLIKYAAEQTSGSLYRAIEQPRTERTEREVWHIVFDYLTEQVNRDTRCVTCTFWNSETHGCRRNPSVEEWNAEDSCSYWASKELWDEVDE